LRALRRDFGVDRVEVALPTHYHDDHVAGMNLLREVEGTEVWSERTVAEVLAEPRRHDLPCLWYDPIPADRVLTAGEPVRWHEYELTTWPLPGHTLYAVAVAVEVDGRRVLATGDQQDGGWADGERTEVLNFQYKNRFQPDDYVASALLYRRLRPELMISGHWAPRPVDDAYLDMLLARGEDLARLHRELLPLSEVDFGAEGFGARIYPYRAEVAAGSVLELAVEAVNPFPAAGPVEVALALPAGWAADPPVARAEAAGGATVVLAFRVRVPTGVRVRRARLAADLTVAGRHFGQHAEALVTVL
jgi:glyoxylase-like metal-dependent hydrolase (beta-lactamase superfamily II)